MVHETEISIRQARIDDIDALVPLFDNYRKFYKQLSDLNLAREFLRSRLQKEDSVIFLAAHGKNGIGFTQLYPSFSSTKASRTFILNDLFVTEAYRGRGIGRKLLGAAKEYGQAIGAIRLSLSTAVDNISAQTLYEGLGWTRNVAFYAYDLNLD